MTRKTKKSPTKKGRDSTLQCPGCKTNMRITAKAMHPHRYVFAVYGTFSRSKPYMVQVTGRELRDALAIAGGMRGQPHRLILCYNACLVDKIPTFVSNKHVLPDGFNVEVELHP